MQAPDSPQESIQREIDDPMTGRVGIYVVDLGNGHRKLGALVEFASVDWVTNKEPLIFRPLLRTAPYIVRKGTDVDYSKSAERMRDLGLDPTVWTNRLMAAGAIARGLDISRTRRGSLLISDSHGHRHYWRSGATGWNSLLSKRIARHKDVCNRLLLSSGVNAAENAVFAPDQVERAWWWTLPLGELVLKPPAGYMGRNVYIGISTRTEFESAFETVAKADGRVLVEKFHKGLEHRCLIISGKLEAVTRRRPASVRGDGQLTIGQLLELKNSNRGKVHKPLSLNSESAQLLEKGNLKASSIPARGRRVYLRRTSNLHQGGDAIDATGTLKDQEVDFIESAAYALPGAKLIGLDVLLPRSAGDSEPLVIEVNTSPMISMHHFPWEGTPRDVTRSILDGMFPLSA